MNNLLNHGWYALETACSRARDEVSGYIVISVMLVAILVLIWIFLSPQVKRKSS